MVNPQRGEIEAVLDGTPYRLCLTLGALAHLECVLACTDLGALAKKFSSGSLRSQELIEIIAAGLQGGGHDLNAHQVAQMKIEGGVGSYLDLVSQLLVATFGSAQDET